MRKMAQAKPECANDQRGGNGSVADAEQTDTQDDER
jgi:hypothetical protein